MGLTATKSLVTRLSVYVIALVFCTSASWTAVFAQDIAVAAGFEWRNRVQDYDREFEAVV